MPDTLVVWDIDRVWYPDISTTYAAKGSKADYRSYLKDFVEEKKWFTHDDVKAWEQFKQCNISSVGDVADMLTDFLYKAEFRNSVYEGVSDQDVKTRTIEGKQALLKGLTIDEIKQIADSVQNTEGLSEAVEIIRNAKIRQVGFSDGLGPFVAYKMYQQGIEVGGIVPALLKSHSGEEWFGKENSYHLLSLDSYTLLGKTGFFKKSDEIFKYLDRYVYFPQFVFIIDDSAANIDTLKKIRDYDGIAVGFNVNDRKKFEEAQIPVIIDNDLRPFAEIVADRRKINEYCETWGIKV